MPMMSRIWMAWSCFRTQTGSTWATIGSSPCSRSWNSDAPWFSFIRRLRLIRRRISSGTADTTRAVAQMLYSNRFAQTPNVKYIFSHAGGTIPYLAGRFAIIDEMNVIPGGEIRGAGSSKSYEPTAHRLDQARLRRVLDYISMNLDKEITLAQVSHGHFIG
jgi:hypothetical protein